MQGKMVPHITGSSSGVGLGDDAKSIMEIRKNTSNRKFENWNVVVLQENGLVRGKTLLAGSI